MNKNDKLCILAVKNGQGMMALDLGGIPWTAVGSMQYYSGVMGLEAGKGS